jgi:hypothetical protein
MNENLKLRILFMLFSISAAIFAGILPDIDLTTKLFSKLGYYFILAVLLLWVFRLLSVFGVRFKQVTRVTIAGFVFSLCLTSIIFYISPPRFKVFGDEANLVKVSRAMYFDKSSMTSNQRLSGVEQDQYDFLNETIDKRPLVFPFLTSLIHNIAGYNANNVFILNFIVSIFILFSVFCLCSEIMPKHMGFLAAIITACLPEFSFSITSGGFEALNLLFILLTLLAVYEFVKHQTSKTAEFLFLCIVIAAQIRYETVLLVIALLVLLPLLIQNKILLKYSWITYFIPFLMIPVLWQQRVVLDSENIHKWLQYIDVPDGSAAFGISNLNLNIPRNLGVFFGIDMNYGFSPVISIMTLIGLYIILKKFVVNFRDLGVEKKYLFIYGSTCFLLLFIVGNLYYFFDFFHPSLNRLSFVFIPCFVFPSIIFLHTVYLYTSQKSLSIMFILLICHLVVSIAVVSHQKLTHEILSTKEYYLILDFIEQNSDPNQKILVITDQHNCLLMHDYDAISFPTANNNKNLIVAKLKHYDRVFVFRKYSEMFSSPYVSTRLDPLFKLSELGKSNIADNTYMQASVIK